MANAEMVVAAETRSDTSRGKNESRRLRRSGRIPAVLYGARKSAVAVSVNPREITHILHSESGHNTIFDLQVGEERAKVMIVDWQYEPVRGALLHVDMKRIAMDQQLRVKVPIMLKGEAEGVKQQGGILEQVLREVEIECLPGDIPGHIDADVTHLVFGTVIRVSDLPHGEKLKFVSDANHPVAHIVAVKEEVVATPEVALEGVVAAPAEPEVIKKGKQETEEEAAAAAAEAGKPEKKEKEKK
ncbi:MAG: 50S ribosomal protein L25 [Terriglobales bacterium]